MNKFSKRVISWFESLLPGTGAIDRIVLKKSVVTDISMFAKENYPKEFAAVLEGRIEKGTVTVTGIIYQHYDANRVSALMRVNLPMISNSVGSVHSHPSGNNSPSRADLQFFAKRGIVNLIICAPYASENIACYDFEGNIREFSIQ